MELTQKLISKNEAGLFNQSENKWIEDNNQLVLKDNKGATLQDLFPVHIPIHGINDKFSPSMNLFYYQRTENENSVLVPFTGGYASRSGINFKYDSDHFLGSVDFPIEENISLHFKRLTSSEYQDFIKLASSTLIDFGWLTSIQSYKIEFQYLMNSLNSCVLNADYLNKLVLKNIPQIL